MSSKHFLNSGNKGGPGFDGMYSPIPDGYPLQAPPFHPSYVFNHIQSARLGPYPRLVDDITDVSHYGSPNQMVSQNGYVHSSMNGNAVNGQIGRKSKSNGRIDAV